MPMNLCHAIPYGSCIKLNCSIIKIKLLREFINSCFSEPKTMLAYILKANLLFKQNYKCKQQVFISILIEVQTNKSTISRKR